MHKMARLMVTSSCVPPEAPLRSDMQGSGKRALKRRLAVRWRRMFSRVRVSACSVIGAFSHGCASACAGLSRRRASVTSSFEIRSFALRMQGHVISW